MVSSQSSPALQRTLADLASRSFRPHPSMPVHVPPIFPAYPVHSGRVIPLSPPTPPLVPSGPLPRRPHSRSFCSRLLSLFSDDRVSSSVLYDYCHCFWIPPALNCTLLCPFARELVFVPRKGRKSPVRRASLINEHPRPSTSETLACPRLALSALCYISRAYVTYQADRPARERTEPDDGLEVSRPSCPQPIRPVVAEPPSLALQQTPSRYPETGPSLHWVDRPLGADLVRQALSVGPWPSSTLSGGSSHVRHFLEFTRPSFLSFLLKVSISSTMSSVHVAL